MKEISTLGIDLAKNKFRVVGMNQAGKVVLRKWVHRDELFGYMANLKQCLVGMEACAGAHYWGRAFEKMGHTVKLMPPQYVKPYVKRDKNDDKDAEACAEAVTRPTMRFVVVKSERQQVLLQWHRVRERLMSVRTGLGNEIRGFLGEFGIVMAKGLDKLPERVIEALEKHQDRLADATSALMRRLLDELRHIEGEIEFYEKKIKEAHEAHPESQRLDSVPGIGEITATALVATISGPEQFKNGRGFSASLGLVPRQHSTGGKSRLGRITKCGDMYIRKLLVQGANSVIKASKNKKDRYNLWVQTLVERIGWCKAAVAIANKNARIAWVILARGGEFDAGHVPQRPAA